MMYIGPRCDECDAPGEIELETPSGAAIMLCESCIGRTCLRDPICANNWNYGEVCDKCRRGVAPHAS